MCRPSSSRVSDGPFLFVYNRFQYSSAPQIVTMSVTSTLDTAVSTALTPAPSTTAPASVPAYPFETWMGNNTDYRGYFMPDMECSAITQAETTLSGHGITGVSTHTEYRNNITHWEDTTRHCRPRVPQSSAGSGEILLPGYLSLWVCVYMRYIGKKREGAKTTAKTTADGRVMWRRRLHIPRPPPQQH